MMTLHFVQIASCTRCGDPYPDVGQMKRGLCAWCHADDLNWQRFAAHNTGRYDHIPRAELRNQWCKLADGDEGIIQDCIAGLEPFGDTFNGRPHFLVVVELTKPITSHLVGSDWRPAQPGDFTTVHVHRIVLTDAAIKPNRKQHGEWRPLRDTLGPLPVPIDVVPVLRRPAPKAATPAPGQLTLALPIGDEHDG